MTATLSGQIEQVERLTGIAVERTYVDRGYQGHGHKGEAQVISCMRVVTSPTIRRELKRRSAVEPVIGHAKSDGLLERNHLAGVRGEAINAILSPKATICPCPSRCWPRSGVP